MLPQRIEKINIKTKTQCFKKITQKYIFGRLTLCKVNKTVVYLPDGVVEIAAPIFCEPFQTTCVKCPVFGLNVEQLLKLKYWISLYHCSVASCPV